MATFVSGKMDELWLLLEAVKDPEVPAISVVELGVVRDIKGTQEHPEIVITPTYSGCPAMKEIEDDIIAELTRNGFEQVKVTTVLSPAWTTDWITEEGKRKLKEFGIAPPEETTADKNFIMGIEKVISCPHCNGKNTIMKSQFGSTACKALHFCNDCQEPFDYFKCL